MKETNINKSFTTGYAEVWIENGIIHSDIHTGDASLGTVVDHINLMGERLKGHLPGRFIVHNKQAANQKSSKAVRDYLAKDENFTSKVKALAVVMETSGFAKIAANLFMKFSKPAYPTKIFADEDKAMEWFEQQQK